MKALVVPPASGRGGDGTQMREVGKTPSAAANNPYPGVQHIIFVVGPEIVDFLGSKRLHASPRPTGKGGGLRPPHFSVFGCEAGDHLDPKN